VLHLLELCLPKQGHVHYPHVVRASVQVLCKAFQHYEGFQMGRMVKNKVNNKNKGAAGRSAGQAFCAIC
jgi:hypothetical protein